MNKNDNNLRINIIVIVNFFTTENAISIKLFFLPNRDRTNLFSRVNN